MPGFTGTIRGGETPSITGRVDASTHHDVRRDPRRAHPVARLLRHRSAIPSSASSRRRSQTDGDELVVAGRPDNQGRHEARRARGQLRRRGRRPVRERPDRHRARRHGRPHRVRAQLERPASGRRLPAPERGRSQGELRGGQGSLSVKILAISGSLRAESYNTALARAAVELAPEGVVVELYEGLALLPPYDQDLDEGEFDPPAAARDLRERIEAADALLIVTPEYNGSIPGVLKNAIDWASARHAGLVLEQDGRHRGRDHRSVRRDLGAAGPAQGARHRRRSRHRRRAPGVGGAATFRRARRRCSTRSSPSACATTSWRSCRGGALAVAA